MWQKYVIFVFVSCIDMSKVTVSSSLHAELRLPPFVVSSVDVSWFIRNVCFHCTLRIFTIVNRIFSTTTKC